jgi:hypothetical protein
MKKKELLERIKELEFELAAVRHIAEVAKGKADQHELILLDIDPDKCAERKLLPF